MMYDRDGAKAFPDATSFLSHGQFDELKKQQNTPSLNLWTNVQRKDSEQQNPAQEEVRQRKCN